MITVIGLGEDGLDGLAPAARALIASAEVLVGGERHLELAGASGAEKLRWRFPLDETMAAIEARVGKRIVVLATGDPMWFGVGVTLARRFGPAALRILPAPSAFSLACARLGWPLAEVECLTLHGRPLEILNGWLMPGLKLLLLSHDGGTPAKVAKLLRAAGFGSSRMVVLERMGGPAEAVIEATAETWTAARTADLNTIALELVAGPEAKPLSRAPGLPDDAFRHDGQLTKREVRAAALARLAPMPAQTLWDVGAGCGSIAIEWLRAGGGAAWAVEREASRRALIAENALALGAPKLNVVEGAAPAALSGLPAPDAVFLGGGLSAKGALDACWAALKPGGRLVATAVTVEGEAALAAARARFGGELVRIAVSRAEPLGAYLAWRPLMPVTLWAALR